MDSIDISQFPILLYADGACKKNGQKNSIGGWGFVLIWDNLTKECHRAGFENHTTNNRMEIKSVLWGLEEIKIRWGNLKKGNVLVMSDSQYTINGASSWMYGWQRLGWRKRKKENKNPLLNIDLWKQMFDICKEINPTFLWIRGHTGNHYNELCDNLADTAIKTQSSYSKIIRLPARGN
jgi:ribonuclease HI